MPISSSNSSFGIAATSNLYGIEGFHLKDVLGVVAVALPEAMHTKHMHVSIKETSRNDLSWWVWSDGWPETAILGVASAVILAGSI